MRVGGEETFGFEFVDIGTPDVFVVSETVVDEPDHPAFCGELFAGFGVGEEESFLAHARCGSGGEETESFFDDAEGVFEFVEDVGVGLDF